MRNTSLAHTALAFLNVVNRVLHVLRLIVSCASSALLVKRPAAATKVEMGEEAAGASAAHKEQAATTAEVDRNMGEEEQQQATMSQQKQHKISRGRQVPLLLHYAVGLVNVDLAGMAVEYLISKLLGRHQNVEYFLILQK